MTETSKEKEAEKRVGQGFTLEVSKLAQKKKVPIIPAIAISIGLILLVFVFLYFFYVKNWLHGDLNDLKTTGLEPEIMKKEFSFKKAIKKEEAPVVVEKTSVLRTNLNDQDKDGAVTPTFQKYKSIPIKSQTTTEESSRSTTPKGSDNNEPRKEANEAAVMAEKIPIDPHFLISEGTYIPCSLTTKFTSDVTGRVTCTVAEDIYGANGAVKLIEKGTKAIGAYQGGNLKHGVGRMFVIWTKLITPDFHQIKLVDSQVVGQLGEAGIEGWIDSHFFERFGGAILLSTAKDILKMTQQKSGKKEGGASVNINTMGETKDAVVAIIEKMLENSINIPPTMYKNQGDIIGILVGRDIDFSKVYKLKMRQ